jgi:hypothetical protein
MGAHKHNPTAILAKEGKLPPKKHRPTNAEIKRWIREKMNEEIENRIMNAFLCGDPELAEEARKAREIQGL